MNDQLTPEVFIKSIRESFIGAEQVYTQGSCIMFYRILKLVFPIALPFWSKDADHLITKIGDDFYDISGKIEDVTGYEYDGNDNYRRVSLAVALPNKKVAYNYFKKPQKL